jgi:hypothetical protein
VSVKRWLPLSGIAFVALVILAVVVLSGEHPESDASGADVLSFYDAHNIRQALAGFVLAASAPFIVFFAMSFADRLWPAGERRPLWERVLIGGSVVTAGATIAGGWVHFALADGGDQGISPEAMQALNVLDSNVWLPVNSGLGVMMLGAAGSLLASGRLPRWLGWTALALGIGLFILFVDFVALILTLIWIIVVSVMLFRAAHDDPRLAPDAAR